MKRITALLISLMLMFGTFAYAGYDDAYIGVYTINAYGNFVLEPAEDAGYNFYFTDEYMAGNIKYVDFEASGLSLEVFRQNGINDYMGICDYYIDNMYNNSDMFDGIVREYNTYGDVTCVTFHGNLSPATAAEMGSNVYSGAVLSVTEGLLIYIAFPYSTGVTTDAACQVRDTLLAGISVHGSNVLSAGSSNSAVSSISSDVYYIGNSIITPPEDWMYFSQSENEVMFYVYDMQIMLGTYAMTTEEMATLRTLDDESLGNALTLSTQVGLDSMSLNSSAFSYYTSYLFPASPVVYFSGDVSAVMGESMWLDGAAMLTDTELAMVMVFSDGTDYVSADDLRYCGVEMFIYE